MAEYDLIVGIDLGMTSTGVAWKSPKTTGIYHLEWESPGKVHRKCPTTLEYELDRTMNQFILNACGLKCAYKYPSLKGKARDQSIRYVEWFKLFLEPAYLRSAIEKRIPWAPTSGDEIFHWFVDYLKFIYQEIRLKIPCEQTLGKPWEASSVHFCFSYPQFWSTEARIRFYESIKVAGFENGEHHKVTVNVTEAEASAIHVIRENPCVVDGKTLLVMDVGGGTTDVVKFQVQFRADGTPQCHNLEPKQKIIGFCNAERRWEEYVHQLLLASPQFQEKEKNSPGWVREVAIGIRRSNWFGSRVQQNKPAEDSDTIELSTIKEIKELFADVLMDQGIIVKEENIRRCLEVVSQPLIEMLCTVQQPPDFFAFVGGVANTKVYGLVMDWVNSYWPSQVLTVSNPALAPSIGAIHDSFMVLTTSIGIVRKDSIEWLIHKGGNVSCVKFKDSFPAFPAFAASKHKMTVVTTDQAVAQLPIRPTSKGLDIHEVCCRRTKKKLMGLTYNLTISVSNTNTGLRVNLESDDPSVTIEEIRSSDGQAVRFDLVQ